MAQKFQKKPVVIEAVQWTNKTHEEVKAFLGSDYAGLTKAPGGVLHEYRLGIHTLEGAMFASDGDWIIRGVKGEHYACKPDIFAATYEPVPAATGGAL